MKKVCVFLLLWLSLWEVMLSHCVGVFRYVITGSGRCPGEGLGYPLQYSWAALVAQTVKNLPATQESWVWEILWKKWQLTPVFLPGESPWMEEPGGLQPMGSQRVGHDWVTKHSTENHMSCLLPAKIWRNNWSLGNQTCLSLKREWKQLGKLCSYLLVA